MGRQSRVSHRAVRVRRLAAASVPPTSQSANHTPGQAVVKRQRVAVRPPPLPRISFLLVLTRLIAFVVNAVGGAWGAPVGVELRLQRHWRLIATRRSCSPGSLLLQLRRRRRLLRLLLSGEEQPAASWNHKFSVREDQLLVNLRPSSLRGFFTSDFSLWSSVFESLGLDESGREEE